MRKLLSILAFANLVSNGTIAYAQDHFEVSRCPDGEKIPVAFEVECSNVADAAARPLCAKFIENVACKAFPAYRKITGVHLEDTCPRLIYRIFDKSSWRDGVGEGGLAGHCEVKYLREYSIDTQSSSGPYDLHEILHEYQIPLGQLLGRHRLFASSMTEAARLIGDEKILEQNARSVRST